MADDAKLRVSDALADPEFYQLDEATRFEVLNTLDPDDFGQLPDLEKRRLIDYGLSKLPSSNAKLPALKPGAQVHVGQVPLLAEEPGDMTPYAEKPLVRSFDNVQLQAEEITRPGAGLIVTNVRQQDGTRIPVEQTRQFQKAQLQAKTEGEPRDLGERAARFVDDFVRRNILNKQAATLEEPMLKPSLLLPDQAADESPLLSGTRGFVEGMEGLTSREAGMVAIGTAGAGTLGTVGKAIEAGITGYFAASAAQGAGQAGARGLDLWGAGDINGAAREWGFGTAEGLFAALMARASWRGGKAAAEQFKRAWDEFGQLPGQPRVQRPGEPPPAGPESGPETPPKTEGVPEGPPRPAETPGGGGGAEKTGPEPPTRIEDIFSVDPATGKVTLTESLVGDAIAPKDSVGLLDAIIDRTNESILDRMLREREGVEPADPRAGEPIRLSDAEFAELFGDWKPKPPEAEAPGAAAVETPAAVPAAPPAAQTPAAPPPSTFRQDDTIRVKTPAGTEARVRYGLVDARDADSSHDLALNPNPAFPKEYQPRDRGRAASEAQILKIMGELDPERLGANDLSDRGAPIVLEQEGGRPLVLSGNGRWISLSRLYEQGHANADAYRAWLAEHAQEFGLDPQKVLSMERPILVRSIANAQDLDLVSFARESNQDDKAAMSPVELARQDAGRLTPQLLEAFHPDEDGNLVNPSNQEFIRLFFREIVGPDAGAFQDENGRISQAGVTRIRNAVFGYAYGADSDALSKLAESTDSNIRNVTNGMLQAAGAIAKMREGIRSGSLHPADIAEDVAAAAAKLSDLREQGQTIGDYLKQIGIFGEELTPEAKAVLAVFGQHGRAAKRIATVLRKYADALEAAGNPGQAGIFGDQAPPTKQELLAAAITAAEKEFHAGKDQPSGPTLFEPGEPPAGPGPAPGDGPQPGPSGPPRPGAGGKGGGKPAGTPAGQKPVAPTPPAPAPEPEPEASAPAPVRPERREPKPAVPLGEAVMLSIIDIESGEGNYVTARELRQVPRLRDVSHEDLTAAIADLARRGELVLSAFNTRPEPGQEADLFRIAAEWYIGVARKRKPDAGESAIPAGLTEAEVAFMNRMVDRLQDGEATNNVQLAAIANEVFGGGRHAGKWEIKQVYDLVEGAVARYIRRQPPNWFEVKALVDLLPRQTDRTEGQIAYQQFSTPPTLGYLAAAGAKASDEDVVMEPSAGTGQLLAFFAPPNLANEIDPKRRAILEWATGLKATAHDAEQLHNLHNGPTPDVIVMNPPFSAAGNRGITKDQNVWMRHVEQALLTVADGGRVVAILPGGRTGYANEGAAFDGVGAEWWRRIMSQYTVQANILLPGNAYGKYGTTYPTRLVVIDKTGHGTDLSNVIQREAKELDEILGIVTRIPTRVGRTAEGEARPEPRPGATGERKPAPAGSGSAPSPRPGGGVGSPRSGGSGKSGPKVGGTEPKPAPGPDRGATPVPGGGGDSAPGESGAVGPPNPTKPEQTPPKPKGADVKFGANDAAKQVEDVGEGTFTRYVPAKLSGGVEHPAPIVQPAPLAAVEPPDITYVPHFDPAIVTEGRVSNVQLEAVVYAGQRHSRQLTTGERAGIFIGDGTGVGKGREVAAIIADNWAQGRRRALWTSISTDLIEDAKRDLKDLGLDIPIRIINDWKATKDIDLSEGIVFSTYASLIGEGKDAEAENAKPVTRVEQLVKWLGEDGVMVFDEAHKAKNAWGEDGEATQTGKAVLEIQEKLPQARVVYASATGATEVRNMAYMTRLGLWGKGTQFEGFLSFLAEIDSGGVGAMEMVARDLKARGAYLARNISYEGVDYRETVHELTGEQRKTYDVAAHAWQQVIAKITEAINQTKAPGRARARAMSQFWSQHQRFFKQLITSMKIPTCIAEIEAALEKGNQVVVSVMTTGEAQQNRMLRKIADGGGTLDDVDWTPREVLDNLILQVFPIHAYEEYEEDGRKGVRPVKDAEGNHVVDKVALAMREQLRDSLTDISLPGNPIDQLVAHFEKQGVGVAELTGRKERIETDDAGKKVLRKRKVEGVATDKTNLAEVAAFQKGQKKIAIISDAASTGISLHASNRADSKDARRTHIALELKWSADKQLQDFGRTHRSDQASAPEYVLLSTDAGGDKRFSATIARRLASLGALTRGSRSASSAGEIAKYNFETEFGRRALRSTYGQMNQGAAGGRETLAKMGLLKRNKDTGEPEGGLSDGDMQDVPRFLNRVLALQLDLQNEVFRIFVDNFARVIAMAKEQGTFDDGVSDLKGAEAIRLKKATEIPSTDPDAKTVHYHLEVDYKTHPRSFDQAVNERTQHELLNPIKSGSPSGFYRNKRSGNIVMAASGGSITNPATGVVTKMYTALRVNGNEDRISAQDLADKWEPVPASLAREWWDRAYAATPKVHTEDVHLIGGAILGVYRAITAQTKGLQVVRAQVDSGERLVGVRIPNESVGDVLTAIGVGRDLVDPEAIWRGLGQGNEVELASDIRLRRTMVHREPAFEVANLKSFHFSMLDAIPGIISERIDGKRRFFIPTDPESGPDVLKAVLERFPAVKSTTGGDIRKMRASFDRGRRIKLSKNAKDALSPANLAAIRFRRRGDTVYANEAAMRAIAELYGLGSGRLLRGAALDDEQGTQIDRALYFVMELVYGLGEKAVAEYVFRRVRDLRQAIAEARWEHGQATLVNTSLPLGALKRTLRHERFHHAQTRLGGDQHIDAEALLLHPLAQVARKRLYERGYADEPVILAAEIGAHLAGGQWEYLGLDRDEAKELFFYYATLIDRKHGKGTMLKLRAIAPQLRGVLHDARQEAEANLLTDRDRADRPLGEGDPLGEGGVRRGVRSDVPARFDLGRDVAGAGRALVTETADEVARLVNPTGRGLNAERAGLALREHAAAAARDFARAEHELERARTIFAKLPWDENLAFINRVEANDPQPTPELQAIADTMRKWLDRARDQVQALGTGKLQTFYQTYFPHIWKRPEKAADAFKVVFGRRPIEGPKGFLKKRKYSTFQEGIDAGLEPAADNAVDLVLLKLREMERYILAHRFLGEMKARGMVRYVPVLMRKKVPPGWVQLPDPIGGVWGPPHVKVREALDAEMLQGLEKFMQGLGIGHRRVPNLGRGEGDTWGLATGSYLRTRFAGPESVMMHEIGHVLDHRYGLADMLSGKRYAAELAELSQLRETPGDSKGQREYYQEPEEQMANMVAAYIHTRRRFERVAPKVFQFFDRFVRQHPELAPLADLEYGMQLEIRKLDYPVGGLILRGHYYMPEDAAQIVKNFLSPGLNGKPWYKAIRETGNLMLQFSLSYSFFHLGNTTLDAMISKLALATEYLVAGKPAAAIRRALELPIAGATTIPQGAKLYKAYLEGTNDKDLQKFVDALVAGGGRVKMDAVYRSAFRQRFTDALHRHEWGRALVTAFPAFTELVMWPTMEYLVPRQKLGTFMDLVRKELETMPLSADPEEKRARFAAAWDAVDNRLGQIVYDNLFWDRTVKDLGMVLVQSLGWNLGTFYELGGGAVDAVRNAGRGARRIIRRGGGGAGGPGGPGGPGGGASGDRIVDPLYTHRTAYLISLVIVSGLMGALWTYLATGEGPKDDKDLFFPRTGGIDPWGKPERVNLPTYMKDLYHWTSHPGQALKNKLNPVVRWLGELLSNEDFWGEMIRNPRDPIAQQGLDLVKHLAKQFTPFSVTGLQREQELGSSPAMQLLPFAGITRAPKYLTQSKAEQRMVELLGDRTTGGRAMDRETAERLRARREITRALQLRDPDAAKKAIAALKDGKVTTLDLEKAAANAARDSSVGRFQLLSIEDALEVYSLGSPEERAKWRLLVVRKVAQLASRSPDQVEAIRRRWGPLLKEIAASMRAPQKGAA